MNHPALSINKSKFIRSLHSVKNRQKYNKYIAEGDKICKEILISNKLEIQYIVGTDQWLSDNHDLLKDGRVDCLVADIADLKKISQLATASQVLLVADIPELTSTIYPDFSLYLEGIQNPGNMGAILRIADWYGIAKIFVSQDCVDVYNPKVIQASMGSFRRVETLVSDLSDLKSKESYQLWGTTLKGDEAFDKTDRKTLLVIGNEGHGISDSTKGLLDKEIKISSGKSLGAESLNASVAAGIFCDRFLN